MNLTAYNPLSSFDQIAIGFALVVVLAVVGWRLLTGRPWRRKLPPDEIDADYFSSTTSVRPRDATPLLNKDNPDDTR